jgi:ubiquitin C-terminal hydrolase
MGLEMNCPNIYSQDTCKAKRIKCDDCGIEDCIHWIKPYEDEETGKEQMYCPECRWRRESKKQKLKFKVKE